MKSKILTDKQWDEFLEKQGFIIVEEMRISKNNCKWKENFISPIKRNNGIK